MSKSQKFERQNNFDDLKNKKKLSPMPKEKYKNNGFSDENYYDKGELESFGVFDDSYNNDDDLDDMDNNFDLDDEAFDESELDNFDKDELNADDDDFGFDDDDFDEFADLDDDDDTDDDY